VRRGVAPGCGASARKDGALLHISIALSLLFHTKKDAQKENQKEN